MLQLRTAGFLLVSCLSAFADMSLAADVQTGDGGTSVVSQTINDLRPSRGSQLYMATCSSCHYRGQGKADFSPPIAIVSSLGFKGPFGAADATELIRAILFGVTDEWGPGMKMPGFERSLTDTDVAVLAAYLRSTVTKQPPWADLKNKVTSIRTQNSKP